MLVSKCPLMILWDSCEDDDSRTRAELNIVKTNGVWSS